MLEYPIEVIAGALALIMLAFWVPQTAILDEVIFYLEQRCVNDEEDSEINDGCTLRYRYGDVSLH
jgi:hypothetical protein